MTLMRHYLPAILALAAIIGGNGLLWLFRPSAEPAAPNALFPPPQSTAESMAATGPRSTPVNPLTLELEPEQQPPLGRGDAKQTLTQAPHLQLDLQPRPAIRPEIDALELFDPDHGSRGFTSRRWLSDHVGIQGGIGYASEPDAPGRRHAAVGLGLVLTY